jgi:hypothetical protein
MSETPGHFCPCCGAPQKPFLRYPWHLCNDCRKRAVDGAGRALEFSNASASGGFMFRYAGEGDEAWRTCRGVVARVDKRPVLITEARFGGIVAEPIPDRPILRNGGICDLRRKGIEKEPLPEPKPRPFPPR